MPDVREVYEMITKQKSAESGALERQQRRQVRAARNKRIGGYAVGAGFVLVVAIAAILATRAGENETTPADQPSTLAPGTISGPFLLDLQTGEKTPLAKNLAGGYSYDASPDGKRLVYGTGDGGGCSANEVVTVANIDGTDARTLQSPEGLNICGARWSRGGTKIVYQERNGANADSVGNLFVQDLASGGRTQLTDLDLTRAWWWFLSPSFSVGDRNVLFHLPRTSSQTTTWDVWSVPVTGGEPTLVLRNASFPMDNPCACPEGLEIQFVLPRANNFEGRSIMTGRAILESDIRSTLVEANNSIWWPTLSPEGRYIAYQDSGSIYVVEVGTPATGKVSKVADGGTAEWLDNDTLIVAP